MDIGIGNFVMNLAVSHQEYLLGIASGYTLAHIPEATIFAFHLAMKIPWFRTAVISKPERSKAIIDAISGELKKDIDEEAKAATPASDAPKA